MSNSSKPTSVLSSSPASCAERGVRRRDLLRWLGAGAAGAAMTLSPMPRRAGWAAPAFASRLRRGPSRAAADGRSARFLFVVTAYGGAELTDSFLPVARSEVSSAQVADGLRVYPDSMIVAPPGSAFRCVRNLSGEAPPSPPFRGGDYELSDFIVRHGEDMCVVTSESTSVNHVVAQGRCLTGDGIDGGRTLMEAVAQVHGESLLVPNCNMSNSGFTLEGTRADTPAFARGVQIVDPHRFALGTHGYRGLPGVPAPGQVDRARAARRQLEELSPLASFAAGSELRAHYRSLREEVAPRLEQRNLIDQLLLLGDRPSEGGLSDEQLEALGLSRSLELESLLSDFPDLGVDELQAQASLAFLLAKHGVASSVAFGLGVTPRLEQGQTLGSPVAFDFSHANHVLSQNINWTRMMRVVDGLISRLQAEPHGDGSMWDHSLVYIATEFGRTKTRPTGADLWQFTSAHDQNNGVILISPLLRGNRVYGGVDPDTLQTYGYDPITGEPAPGSRMTMGHVYSLICQAMGVEFSGRHDMSGLLR